MLCGHCVLGASSIPFGQGDVCCAREGAALTARYTASKRSFKDPDDPCLSNDLPMQCSPVQYRGSSFAREYLYPNFESDPINLRHLGLVTKCLLPSVTGLDSWSLDSISKAKGSHSRIS